MRYVITLTQGAERLAFTKCETMLRRYGTPTGSTLYTSWKFKIIMQERKDIIENVIGFDALYNSMMKCKRGVMWKGSVQHYCLNAIEETIKLEESLKNGKYKAREPVKFKIKFPKEREIVSIAFRDRVYQRSLNDNSIYPQMVRGFIKDNFACQKGKGTDAARNRLEEMLKHLYRLHGLEYFVAQDDIRGYYPNMRHDVTKKKFKKKLDDWTYRKSTEVLDAQYTGEIGYNPGSQMVQIAGISVLDDLDHFIKERLHIKCYIRYMDDFILMHQSKEYLEYCQKEIKEHLKRIGFETNEKKTKVYSVKKNVRFLGFDFRITNTGKVIRTLEPGNVKHERLKLRRLVNKAKRGEMTKEKVDECYKGWKAHAEKANSYKLLKRMDKYYKELWGKENASN